MGDDSGVWQEDDEAEAEVEEEVAAEDDEVVRVKHEGKAGSETGTAPVTD